MRSASIGAVEQANRVTLVTVSSNGELLDRRTVELTTGLPTHPHHHEGAWAMGRYLNTPGAKKASMRDAVKLVERVRKAALVGARKALEALAGDVSSTIKTISIRSIVPMPEGIEARIRDNRAQTMADSAMYREVLALAAAELGWSVHWYEREALSTDVPLRAPPPWTAAHKLAAAAALSRGVLIAKKK